MSVIAMSWAWQQKGTSSQKLVLLCLADHADHDGICWPGQHRVSEKCDVSRETVIRVIQHYEERGKIEVIRRHDEAGRTLTNSYRLVLENVDDQLTPKPKKRKSRKEKQEGGVTNDHRGVTFRHRGEGDISSPGEGDISSPGEGDISSPLEPSIEEPSIEEPSIPLTTTTTIPTEGGHARAREATPPPSEAPRRQTCEPPPSACGGGGDEDDDEKERHYPQGLDEATLKGARARIEAMEALGARIGYAGDLPQDILDEWAGQLLAKARRGEPVDNAIGYLRGIMQTAHREQAFALEAGIPIRDARKSRTQGASPNRYEQAAEQAMDKRLREYEEQLRRTRSP